MHKYTYISFERKQISIVNMTVNKYIYISFDREFLFFFSFFFSIVNKIMNKYTRILFEREREKN